MARLPDRRAAAAGKRKFLGVGAESTRESLDDLDAFSIAQFCWRHNISESFYHKLRTQGRAPRLLRLGGRVLITKEAAAEWRAAREAETAQAMSTESAESGAPGLRGKAWK
jgi:hypothetical protein